MHNWRNIIVHPETPLLDVLVVLDQEAMQIALVESYDGFFLGTITDGDIRRFLLQQGNLNAQASDVMNESPIHATVDMSYIEAVSIMEQRSIFAIPIIDENKHIHGLHTLHQYAAEVVRENPVFIMAGGFGTRLQPLTNDCPKPMLNVGGRPILETILEGLIKAGFYNFYLSTHYMPEKIRDYFGNGEKLGCKIQYVHEETPLGTGGALGLLPKSIVKLPIIMANGDILTKVDYKELLRFHKEKGGIATMCVRHYEYQIPFGVIKEINGRMESVVEKPKYKDFVNAGIYVLNPEILDSIMENQNIDMPPLLMQEVGKGEEVFIFPIHEYWQDIGQHDELAMARVKYDELF